VSLPSFDTEARIQIALLYYNDDLGKDFLNAFEDILKATASEKLLAASYEVTDPDGRPADRQP
jgi:branched-chain amino acid transport system substrate-binding protein